jgi:hypothetical protein
MQAFITGSHVYGQPHPDSDIDMVLLCRQPETEDLLVATSDNEEVPVQYGKLNLIICDSHEKYQAWKDAMIQCVTHRVRVNRPLTREEAVKIHNACGATGYEKVVT